MSYVIKQLDIILKNTVHIIKTKYSINYCILCEGNIYARTLVIGEAPGIEEEKHKRIFIGQSGKILRNIMCKLQIEEYIFFINTIPFKPYIQRNPSLNDIINFESVNTEIINLINPQYIICFGKVATTYIKRNINNIHNKNVIIANTFHPAYYVYTKQQSVLDSITSSILWAMYYKCEINNYTILTHLWQ